MSKGQHKTSVLRIRFHDVRPFCVFKTYGLSLSLLNRARKLDHAEVGKCEFGKVQQRVKKVGHGNFDQQYQW